MRSTTTLLLWLVLLTRLVHATPEIYLTVEHQGTVREARTTDVLTSGDTLIFHYQTREDGLLEIAAQIDHTFQTIWHKQLAAGSAGATDPIILDDQPGTERFALIWDGKTVAEYRLEHRPADPAHRTASPRHYIDPETIRSSSRNAADVRVYQTLSPATVVVHAGANMGAGVILSQAGDIVTNWHVVKDTAELFIDFKPPQGSDTFTGKHYRAHLIRTDPTKDLALLRLTEPEILTAKQITPIPLADLNRTHIGDDVHSIGHPRGYYYSLSRGMISGVLHDHSWQVGGRHHRAHTILQVQTNSSPGNSGAPLVNERMELLGLMTYSDTRGDQLNFAVSAEDIRAFLSSTSRAKAPTPHGDTPHPPTTRETALHSPIPQGAILRDLTVLHPNGSPMLLRKLDTNHNGIADCILLDIDRDNRWDRIYFDRDEDNWIDERKRLP